MVPWYYLIVAVFAGTCFGLFAGGLDRLASRADEAVVINLPHQGEGKR
jgi:hypothetical protein